MSEHSEKSSSQHRHLSILMICILGIHLSWHNPSRIEHNYSYKHGSYHIQFQLHKGNSSFYYRCVAAQMHLGKICGKLPTSHQIICWSSASDVFTWRKVTIAENTDSLFPGVTTTLHCSNMRAHHFSSAGESSRNAREFLALFQCWLNSLAPPPLSVSKPADLG